MRLSDHHEDLLAQLGTARDQESRLLEDAVTARYKGYGRSGLNPDEIDAALDRLANHIDVLEHLLEEEATRP